MGGSALLSNGWEAISLKRDEFHLKLRSEQYIHGRNDIDRGVWESIITGEIWEIISTNSLGEITWPEAYKFGGKKNKKDNWQGDFTPTTTRRIMDIWALHDTIGDLKYSGLLWDNSFSLGIGNRSYQSMILFFQRMRGEERWQLKDGRN